MKEFRGICYAFTSSSTFGLAPFFTLCLLHAGYSSFEVLSYRWGIASLALGIYGWLGGCGYRLERRVWGTVFCLCLLRAATSLSLVFAYQWIASGTASIIHFMYPLAVTLAMMFFFGEPKSGKILAATAVSIAGAVLLSAGNMAVGNDKAVAGMLAATLSVFTYAGYIIGVRKSRAAEIDSTVLTTYVMGGGALLFIIGGCLTGGVRLETEGHNWLYILGISLPATAISNMTLVKAIKSIGPTLTSIFGAMEPLTAVAIGILAFDEALTPTGVAGMALIIAAVTAVVLKSAAHETKEGMIQ